MPPSDQSLDCFSSERKGRQGALPLLLFRSRLPQRTAASEQEGVSQAKGTVQRGARGNCPCRGSSANCNPRGTGAGIGPGQEESLEWRPIAVAAAQSVRETI